MRSIFTKGNRPYSFAFILLSIFTALLLIQFYSDSYIHSDAAQNLSVAKNILNGQGLKTDIIYYQQHHDYGSVPAVQTVFPPGLPIIIATFHTLTGLSLSLLLYILCILSFLIIPIQVFLILQRMRLGSEFCFIIACSCYVFSYFWVQILNFGTELLFTVVILICVMLISNNHKNNLINYKKLFLIGLLGGGAVFIRYVGVFFVISIFAYYLLKYLNERNKKALAEMFAVGIFASIIPMLLFVRNYYYTESITGGPNVVQGGSLYEVMYAIRWQFSMLFGYFLDGKKLHLAEILLLFTSFLLVFYVVKLAFWDKVLLRIQVKKITQVAIFSYLYITITIFILLIFSLTKSPGYFNARYLMTLYPFFLFIIGDAIKIISDSGVIANRKMKIMAVVIFIIFLAGQYKIFIFHYEYRIAENTEQALIKPLQNIYIENMQLYDFLRKTTSKDNPLLTNKAQRLWIFLQRPVVSFTPSLFTQTKWDNDKVLEMIESYNIKYILLYKKFYAPNSTAYINQVFYKNLINEEIPEWLELIESNDDIMFFRVK